MPDGFLYRASLDKIGETTELSVDGCILAGSYTLSGCRHDLLDTARLPAGGGHRLRGRHPRRTWNAA